MSGETGRLKISMPSVDAAIRPTVNVIDSETLTLVDKVRCDEPVDVPAGTYVLSSTLPSGEQSVAFANVAAGASEEVELVPVDAMEAQTAGGAAASSHPLDTVLPQAVAEPAGPADTQLFVRYLCFGRDGLASADASAEADAVSDEGRAVELVVHAGDCDGVLFAQFATAGEVPLSVGLPINARTRSTTCRVTVTARPLTANVTLPDNPLADAVARYLYTGNLQQAASIAETADTLVHQDDPFGAVLGGYALLRLGARSRLGTWPQEFARSVPWLPDSAVLAGATAALHGEHPQAAEWYCEAAARGLPVFVDGFSLLLSGLREYDDANTPAGVPEDLVAAAGRHANRLLPVGALIDYARISLAVHGLRLDDPANSQEERAETEADEWRPIPMTVGQPVA